MAKFTHAKRLGVSAGLAGASILVAPVHYYIGGISLADGVMVAAGLIAVWPIAKKAFSVLRYRIVGIDALVTLAVIGAILIGEYWEAAAVSILFLLGEYLEARALEKTRSAIKSLLNMAPARARVLRQGQELEVSPNEVALGETVIVRPGEKVPVDGLVTGGEAYVNQATITGESMPAELIKGNEVYSGSVLESGYLQLRATKVGQDTMFSRILQLVEEAQDKKAKTQAFLERFARWYTPAVIVLSVAVLVLTSDIYLALTLLVIACPGALVIATPVSIVAGIGSAAKNGVLIKGGEVVEQATRVRAVAFDKTGTLTDGHPKVSDIFALSGSKRELLSLAASAEKYSEHPLARAVVQAAEERDISLTEPEASDLIIGQGVKATVGERDVLVGNQKLLQGSGVTMPKEALEHIESQQRLGRTVVLIAEAGRFVGALSISDTIRRGAVETISQLRKSGKHTVMLTGDNSLAASTIAAELGVNEYYAELLPQDKVAKVAELKQRFKHVAMVGDGINDAPALAAADLGVAVGGPGKDVAMETAGMVLLSGSVNRLGYAFGVAKNTVINMKQNIYFAVFVVVVLLAGVLLDYVHLASGMLVHVISVLLVIVNAIRLLRYNDRQ